MELKRSRDYPFRNLMLLQIGLGFQQPANFTPLIPQIDYRKTIKDNSEIYFVKCRKLIIISSVT